MYITGCHYRFIKPFSKRNDPAVYISDILFTVYISDSVTLDHKTVIPKGLYFQIIIEIHDSCNPFLRLFV